MLSKICSHMTCFPNEPAETKHTLAGAGSLSRHPVLDMVGGKKHPSPWGDSALVCCQPTFCLSWGVSKHLTPSSGVGRPVHWQLPKADESCPSFPGQGSTSTPTPLSPAAPHTPEAGGTHLQASHNSPAAGRGQSWRCLCNATF